MFPLLRSCVVGVDRGFYREDQRLRAESSGVLSGSFMNWHRQRKFHPARKTPEMVTSEVTHVLFVACGMNATMASLARWLCSSCRTMTLSICFLDLGLIWCHPSCPASHCDAEAIVCMVSLVCLCALRGAVSISTCRHLSFLCWSQWLLVSHLVGV